MTIHSDIKREPYRDSGFDQWWHSDFPESDTRISPTVWITPQCPFSRPLVRGPRLPARHVPMDGVPIGATEYHVDGRLWRVIPESWKVTNVDTNRISRG
jgi:hypothetical protein